MNKNTTNIANELGLFISEILLPNENINLEKWSVIACDQHTSEKHYWTDVEEYVSECPSTLHMIVPEIYLKDDNIDEKISNVNKTMDKYISEEVLISKKEGIIFVDRKTLKSRKGLILAIDLEKYDYTKNSSSLIRSTEETVIERLPPRVNIRENASLELPHVMLLIDDPLKTVIEPLISELDTKNKLYDFDLMMNGNNIKGYKIDDEVLILKTLIALKTLINIDNFKKKYNLMQHKEPLLFAVGDGNHSLAAAKVHYENIKKCIDEKDSKKHPARFALVEIVNIHDDSINFEPIHRIMFNVNITNLLDSMIKFFNSSGKSFYKIFSSKELLNKELELLRKNKDLHAFPFITKDSMGLIIINDVTYNLEVGTLQFFLDDYLKHHKNSKIDYIHGEDSLLKLAKEDRNIGFLLPKINKNKFFETIILDGVLPRKTFSMGESFEKRYYLECRKIK